MQFQKYYPVSGFEAYIGDKHIVGQLKKKEEARREYRQAVAAGHGAYLMEQEEPVNPISAHFFGPIFLNQTIPIDLESVFESVFVLYPRICVISLFTKILYRTCSLYHWEIFLRGTLLFTSRLSMLQSSLFKTTTYFLLVHTLCDYIC